MKKIVIALGGNALGNSPLEQKSAAKHSAKVIADLIAEGHQVVISHGNGPQVGMIESAMSNSPASAQVSMAACVAMSQAYIGFDLQNCLREELCGRRIQRPVTSIITQVRVNSGDIAFDNPTKPIGSFMTRKQAETAEAAGWRVVEDSGRGYRRVVASPRPVDIVEMDAINALVNAGQVVIACGGGGIPVVEEGSALLGVNAVVDKDFASAKLAQLIDADCLVILTAVEKVAVNFGKENQKWISKMSIEEARGYIQEGHFAAGSMLPKVQAAIEFASSKKGRYALVTLLEKAEQGIRGETGTIITNTPPYSD